MMPIVFSWGELTLFSLGFWLAIGIILASFIAWRRLMELGLGEEKTLDLILLSIFWGLILARLIFIAEHFSQFGFQFSRWLFLREYPGFSFWGGIGGAVLVVLWFSQRRKWNSWQVLDELVFAFLPLMVLIKIGVFFDGSEMGKATSMPWGIFFPGRMIRCQPISLFFSLGFLLLWLFFLRIERRWRSWSWYQSQASGLLVLILLFGASALNLLIAFWRDIPVYWLGVEAGLSFLALVGAGIVIWRRSQSRRKGGEKESRKTKRS